MAASMPPRTSGPNVIAAESRGPPDGSGAARGAPRRALLPDPRDYSPEIWRRCLLASLDHEAIEEQEALRRAAELARESHGLEFKRLREDGVILGGLRAALDEALRTGEVRKARGRVFKPPSGGV
jgi:hypothetical protein